MPSALVAFAAMLAPAQHVRSPWSGSIKGTHMSPATHWFFEDLQQLPAQARVVIFDVGANSGAFASWLVPHIQRLAPQVLANLTMVEPQPMYHRTLTDLARRLRSPSVAAHFLPAMAAARDGRSTLFLSKNPESSSPIESAAARFGARRGRAGARLAVDAVDLGRLLREAHAWRGAASSSRSGSEGGGDGSGSGTGTAGTAGTAALAAVGAAGTHAIRGTHAVRPLIYLKMDIEGGEASLIPTLLVSGAL